MPEDYIVAVLKKYRQKREEGSLSPNLLKPTPGSLREECILNCRKDIESKDKETLRLFFGNADGENGYLKNIENSKAEKFKQLPKIMKGGVTRPGVRHIELISWLVDFKPRPSTAYYKSFYEGYPLKADGSKAEIQAGGEELNGGQQEDNIGQDEAISSLEVLEAQVEEVPAEAIKVIKGDESKSNEQETVKPEKKLRVARLLRYSFILIVVALGTGGGYILWQNNQCMYWTGDHYERINCNEPASAPVVAWNRERAAQLRKITRSDTITYSSIGKLWWAKVNGELEYYTAGGDHPVIPNKRLLPLTKYMIDTHIPSR